MSISLENLAKGRLRSIEKHIPALDDSVFIRQIAIADIDALNDIDDDKERGIKLICMSLTDIKGDDCTPELAEQIMNNNCGSVGRQIQQAIFDVNSMGAPAQGEG